MQLKQQPRHVWLMAGFISMVIIAGCFGPYMISLVLAGLSVACFATLG